MAEWSQDNRACKTLWTTLYTMDQLSSNFQSSGDLKMSDLTYYNPTASPDLRRQEATAVADQLDNVFRNARGAQFEEGYDRSKAVADMVEVLTEADKQVKDLAAAADKAYQFFGEE